MLFRFFPCICLIFSTLAAHAQTGISTPTYHVDTATYTWVGLYSHTWVGMEERLLRQEEWIGTCPLFKCRAHAIYEDGQLNGPWTVYYSDGSRHEEGNYTRGLRDGKWITYDHRGDTLLLCHYKLGALHGVYRLFHTGNLVSRQGVFVNGLKEGAFTHTVYTASGRVHARTTYTYVHDVLEGPVTLQTFNYTTTSWYESGMLVRNDSSHAIDSSFANVPWPPPDDPVLSFADEMPVYGTGNADLQYYIRRHIRYPKSAVKKQKEGTCYVQLTVEKDGSVTDVVLIKGVAGAPELGEEAVRVIETMPPWTPGRVQGRPVRVMVTIPVSFKL